MKSVDVNVKDLTWKRIAIRSLQVAGLDISSLMMLHQLHNGCRPPKRPRG